MVKPEGQEKGFNLKPTNLECRGHWPLAGFCLGMCGVHRSRVGTSSVVATGWTVEYANCADTSDFGINKCGTGKIKPGDDYVCSIDW